jgi:hypothetical protein
MNTIKNCRMDHTLGPELFDFKKISSFNHTMYTAINIHRGVIYHYFKYSLLLNITILKVLKTILS